MSTKLDNRQVVQRAVLPMVGNAANDTEDTVLPKIDAELAKLFEDRNVLLDDGGVLAFSGTALTFTQNLKIVLNQKISGAAPQSINLGSTTVSFGSSGTMWWAVIDRTAGTATTSTGTTMPAVSSSNQEVFLLAKRSDSADATVRLYLRNGQAFDAGQSAKLGGSTGGGTALTVKSNGTNIDTSTATINFTGPGAQGVVDVSTGNVAVPLSDGYFDPSPMIGLLESTKAATALLTKMPDQIIDVFSSVNGSAVGTLSNLTQTGGQLKVSIGQTSGTYNRSRSGFANSSQVQGVIKHSLQQMAPANTALSPSNTSTAVTMSFTGDVTPYFTASKNVIIAQLATSDSEIQLLPVKDTSGTVEKVALFSITSATFSSGTTSVVIANPNAFDLSTGLSSANFNASLRVIPFDYTVQAKSAGSLATLNPIDLYALNNVGIQTPSSLAEVMGTIAGTVVKTDANMSPNGQYLVIKAIEASSSSTTVVHWIASADFGNSWVEVGTRTGDTSTAAVADDFAATGLAIYANPQQIVVANNGKFFSAYQAQNTSVHIQVKAVYADLTAGIVTLNDAAPNTTVTTNYNSIAGGNYNAPGTIFSTTGSDLSCQIAADLADLSYIVVEGKFHNGFAGSTYAAAVYTVGGATFSQVYNYTATSPVFGEATSGPILTGSSGSHRFVTLLTDAANSGHISIVFWSEGDAAPTFTANKISAVANYWIQDTSTWKSTNAAGLYSLFNSNNATTLYANVSTASATPAVSAARTLSSLSSDSFVGTPQTAISSIFSENYSKVLGQRIVIDPSNSNHIFFVTDLNHPDGVKRATLFEVPDDSATLLGAQISNYSTNTTINLRDTSTNTNLAQTFTVGGTGYKLNTAVFAAYQVGNIAAGTVLQAKLYATSAGAPTGAALATSTNSYDPSLITSNTSAQYLYFNFASVSLTASVVYAISLEANYTISATNFLHVLASTANPYAGGNEYTFNGTTWSSVAANDFVFEINVNWVTDIGNASYAAIGTQTLNYNNFGSILDNQESTIRLVPGTTNQIQFLTRRMVRSIADTTRPLLGHSYGSTITISAAPTTTQSTNTAIGQLGYSTYDPNLSINVYNGDSGSNRLTSIFTGVSAPAAGTQAQISEDRCGEINYLGQADASITYALDSNFQQGICGVFDGAHSVNFVGNNTGNAGLGNNLKGNTPFIIEAEIFPAVLNGSGQNRIVCGGRVDSGAASGWMFLIVNNFLGFEWTTNSSSDGVSTASDKSEPLTYHKVRVTYDGANKAKLFRAESAPYTAFTEVGSYSTQVSPTLSRNYAGEEFQIGAGGTGGTSQASFFNGKIGYVKMAKNIQTFVNNGYSSQPAITGIINLGSMFLAKQRIGPNALTVSPVNMYNQNMIGFTKSIVAAATASYELYTVYNQSFATANQGSVMSLQITQGKASDSDLSGMLGLNFRFLK